MSELSLNSLNMLQHCQMLLSVYGRQVDVAAAAAPLATDFDPTDSVRSARLQVCRTSSRSNKKSGADLHGTAGLY